METKEKPKDPNDPREHQAIPHAIQSIAIVAVVAAILVAINVGIWFACRDALRPENSRVVLFAFSTLGMAAISMLALWGTARTAFDIQSDQSVRGWLKAYWLRNVRGYRLACFFGHPLTGKPLLHSIIAPGAPVVNVAQPTLLIPLGGWFRRPTIVEPKDHRPTVWPLKRGQVKMVGRLELLHQDGTADAIARNVVQLTDATGDRHTTTVWGALEILEQYGVRALSDPYDGTLRRVFGDLSRRTESLTHDVQRLTEEVESQRNGALIGLAEAIIAIESSSRIKDTLEGLLLHRQLLTRIIAVCQKDESKEHWQSRLAVVDAQIAEKQKRDRRRHGKPATSPAP